MSETKWRRSSKCEQGACVEVAGDGDDIVMRDSKHPDGPVLRFTRDEWTAFVGGVVDGEFNDLAG